MQTNIQRKSERLTTQEQGKKLSHMRAEDLGYCGCRIDSEVSDFSSRKGKQTDGLSVQESQKNWQ